MSSLNVSQMLPPTAAIPAKPGTGDPKKIEAAAHEFEALLLTQILNTVSQGGGWLGSGEDSSSSCANGFAQEQLASMMAKQGGLGLSKLIAAGLERGR